MHASRSPEHAPSPGPGLLTPDEQQVLLACARLHMDAAQTQQTRARLQHGLRWDHLTSAARHHGLTPLLYRHLRRLDADGCVPAPVADRLRLDCARLTRHQARLQEALAEVVKALRGRGVKPVLLKGPDLARRVYGDPALRPFMDLDLLVEEDKLEAARQALLDAGFALEPRLLSERLTRRYHFNLPFVRPGALALPVELHWRLVERFSPYTFDTAGMRARCTGAVVAGEQVLVLDPVDLLLYLAVHVGVHGYLNAAAVAAGLEKSFVWHPSSENRVIWFTDIHALLSAEGDNVDLQVLRERARQVGVEQPLATTMAIVDSLLGHGKAAEMAAMLPAPTSSFLRRSMVTRMMAAAPAGRDGGWLRTLLLGKRETVQFRLLRLPDAWHHVFPGADGIRRRYAVRAPLVVAARSVGHAVKTLAFYGWLAISMVGCLVARAWCTKRRADPT